MENKRSEFFKKMLTDRLDELQYHAGRTISEFREKTTREIEHIDQASASADDALKLKIRNRESKLIKKVREALEKIEDGTYGICELCGGKISEKRLEARPVTTKCIKCKQAEEQKELLGK